MPDNTGRSTPLASAGGARRNNVPSTPNTQHANLPNTSDLPARIAASTGPVKNAVEAKAFLEQRSLIAVENNYDMETLANLLLTTSFEAKIPDHVINVIRAVAFLMIGHFSNTFAEDIAVALAEKLVSATEYITKQLDVDREFLAASAADQAKHTQRLTSLAESFESTSKSLLSTTNTLNNTTESLTTTYNNHTTHEQKLKDTTTSLQTTTEKLTSVADNVAKATTDIQPAIQTVSKSAEHITALAESAKALAKAVEDLKNAPPPSQPPQPAPQSSQPTYASIAAASSQRLVSQPSYSPDAPDYVVRIENKLRIQERQVYIAFDDSVEDSPKERGGPAAYALRGKLNEWIRTLDQETNQVMSQNGQPIKALQFTERSAMLLEFESKEYADRFRAYCAEKNLLTRICSTAKIQTRSYRLVLKFVPCDGSFSPEDTSQLRAIETEHKLEEGTILAASWIKKPERRSPNQKTANVKLICSSPVTANRLLMERIFIANTRVIVIKDTQEPIRCNKCQEYGHIRDHCGNAERCANCARPHPTTECRYPNDPHCVSCGTSSNHASSDKGKCPQFSKHASSLDSRLPENTLPYFPILGQPSTFALAAKNVHRSLPNFSNHPNPTTANPQQHNQQPPPQHQTPHPPLPSNPRSQLPARLTQTTIGQNGQIIAPLTNVQAGPSRQADNGWQTQSYRRGPPQTNANSIPLPQAQTLDHHGFVRNPPSQFQSVGRFFNAEDYAGQSW